MSEWIVEFDGLYEPRYRPDGVATYGFVVRRDGATIHEARGLVAPPASGASANVAEFGALAHALEWLRGRISAGDTLVVRGDSRLVIETVAGRWNLSTEHLVPLRDFARSRLEEIGAPARLEKVSREDNARADALTREAYREAMDAHPEWRRGAGRG